MNPRSHFKKRAGKYNHSSYWVNDPELIKKICDLAAAGLEARVLDLAIGTGKIAKVFHKKVKEVVGIDICPQMSKQAKQYADRIILTPAEKLPLKNNIFDACVCRQGLQFMDLKKVIPEIYRVLKPGGRLVLCHLTAYGDKDKKETFLIQKLRNPARRNFFLPADLTCLLKKQAFKNIKSFEYITKESVNQWIDNGALDETAKVKIRKAYEESSFGFRKAHKLKFENGDIFDNMKMMIVKAVKEG